MLFIGSLFSAVLLFQLRSFVNAIECYSSDGTKFAGHSYITASNGRTCLRWTDVKLKQVAIRRNRADLRWKLQAIELALQILDGSANHSYCRNVLSTGVRPWCYTIDTTNKNIKWAYCNVPTCSEICQDTNNPCNNDGQCNRWTNGTGYNCVCSSGFTGQHCDQVAVSKSTNLNGASSENGGASPNQENSSNSSPNGETIFIVVASVLGALILIVTCSVGIVFLVRYFKRTAPQSTLPLSKAPKEAAQQYRKSRVRPANSRSYEVEHDNKDNAFNPYKADLPEPFYPRQDVADGRPSSKRYEQF